ncbi:MAG: 50S ribosomal protein L24 [Leeuwenhoekiella sp.]
MMKLKIKVGDSVKVMAGDHKDQEGKVLSVDKIKNKAIVEGVNMIKKHQKPSASNPQGGIVEKEAALHISNLALVDKNGDATRIGYRMEDGKKVRYAKTTNDVI